MLGIKDLANRWNYTTCGIYKKMKNDPTFPKPIAIINSNKVRIFAEEDIVKYESNHKELTDKNYKRWYTHKWCFNQRD